MKSIMVFLLTMGLSGCVLSPTGTVSGSASRYETNRDQMNSYVGLSKQELTAKLGNPNKKGTISPDSEIWIFEKQNPFTIVGCTYAFQIDDGVVVKWGQKGCPIRDNKKDYKQVPKSTPVPEPTLDIFNLPEMKYN